jgi:hypothetical protein
MIILGFTGISTRERNSKVSNLTKIRFFRTKGDGKKGKMVGGIEVPGWAGHLLPLTRLELFWPTAVVAERVGEAAGAGAGGSRASAAAAVKKPLGWS